jgi:GntR family transcriptional regulator
MQVKDGLRHLIVSGALPPDYRLQSVRELAAELAINPNTIQRAYRELEAEGYICSVPGKGSFTCARTEVDQSRVSDLLNKFDKLAAELMYLGISASTLCERLDEGGKKND